MLIYTIYIEDSRDLFQKFKGNNGDGKRCLYVFLLIWSRLDKEIEARFKMRP